MVIAPGQKGITAHVILGDNEALPANLNTERVIVYRRGDSTNRELELVKALGVVLEAGHEALRDKSKPVCNYSGDGNPLHEHADGTFWFYEETWAYENGPFPTYEEAYNALSEYCVGLEQAKEIAVEMAQEKPDEIENPEPVPGAEVKDGVGYRFADSTDVPAGTGEVGDGVEN